MAEYTSHGDYGHKDSLGILYTIVRSTNTEPIRCRCRHTSCVSRVENRTHCTAAAAGGSPLQTECLCRICRKHLSIGSYRDAVRGSIKTLQVAFRGDGSAAATATRTDRLREIVGAVCLNRYARRGRRGPGCEGLTCARAVDILAARSDCDYAGAIVQNPDAGSRCWH